MNHFTTRTNCAYPGVTESHTDGGVDGHAEVTLRPLHVQGEVSG